MSDELEIAALLSAGALKGEPPDAREWPTDSCANCDAEFTGRYCPECGQLASDFHRPILSLFGSIIGDTFSLDGRLIRTLPALLLRPGHVTRAYLEGRRARYVPPFRMFLVSSLLFFTALFIIGDSQNWFGGLNLQLGDDDTGGFSLELGNNTETKTVNETEDSVEASTKPVEIEELVREDGTLDRDKLTDLIKQETEFDTEEERDAALKNADSVSDKLNSIMENKRLYLAIIKDWAPRLSLLMFPIFAIFLTLLYAWRRRVFVYDHLVTSLHFQSFLYLSGTIFMLAGFVVGGWAGAAFGILTPVYLYRLLRKTYGTGRIMALIRTSILSLASLFAFSSLLVALVVIGYLQV